MKIICLEEHTMDPAIAKAVHDAQAAEAGYMADIGSRVAGDPDTREGDRPHHLPIKTSLELGRDVGAGRLAEMDRHGIDMQILSYSNPLQLAPAGLAAGLARDANDRLAEAVGANPTRFRAFAILPWQDPQAAARELERTVTELDFVGALVSGRPGRTFLDDASYEPVLAKLAELKVPLYVHPGFPLPQVREPYYAGFNDEVSARLSLFGWGWHNEAGVQIIRLMLAGVFDRHPDLRVISGHWGEMVPFYLPRMDDAMPREATGLARSLTDTYRAHIYVTPSGMLYGPQFEFILKVLGADRILYAVDYPYLSNTGARRFLENFPLDDQDRYAIAHANAERLLRL